MLFSVKHCSSVPLVIGAVTSTDATAVGTVVTYTCHQGYRLDNGLNRQTMKCTTSAQWSHVPQDCKGD
jgi:hypothetical protein